MRRANPTGKNIVLYQWRKELPLVIDGPKVVHQST
jgi:hypothetical protein